MIVMRRNLVTIVCLFYFCQAAVITLRPVPATVPPLTTATFTCEGTGDILDWLVQSAPLTDSIKQQREITVNTTNIGTTNIGNTNFSSVLTVNAIPINDGLGIGCEVITFDPFNRVISSSNLTIRGVSSVQDLSTFPLNNSLLITWSPPAYYSNDIPAGSPISYQVLVTGEGDKNIILDTTTPDKNITVPNVSDCDTFNISVTALLAQHRSINDVISRNRSLGYNATITTNEDNFIRPNVTIELSCPPSQSNTSLAITSDSTVIDQYTFTGTDESINDIRTLVPSNEYNYTVRVFNLRNKLQYETHTIISTYQVIGVYINNTYTNGSVSVQCIYQQGSTADGCHVIFTDTSNGRNEYFNITGSDNTIISVSAGNYTVLAFDIVNGSLFGPAVQYPTPVVIINMIPSTSSSSIIMNKSTAAPTQSTFSNTVSPTVTVTVGIGTETSPTSRTINDANNYVIPVVAGIFGGIALVACVILTITAVLIVYKRKRMKVLNRRSEFATVQQPQAETNHYQDAQELRNEVPNITGSPVQLTNNRPIDEENPYHVTRSEGLTTQGQRPSPTSMATQETILEDSISSTTSNDNIHDNAYTNDPNATDAHATADVNDTDTTTFTVTNTDTATVAPTYASIAKGTDTTAIPATADQHVVYSTVTGDINKKGGGVTVYSDVSAQECGAIVQKQVTGAALDCGQYDKDDCGTIDTLRQNTCNSTNIMDLGVLPIPHFQDTGETVPFSKSFLDDEEYITDDMDHFKPNAVANVEGKHEILKLFKDEVVIGICQELKASKKASVSKNVFEDTLVHENYEVPKAVPSIHGRGSTLSCNNFYAF